MRTKLFILITTIFACTISLNPIKAQEKWNFGSKIGMYNYQMANNISGRYNDIDVKVHTPIWNIYEPRFPYLGVFIEQPLKNLPFFSITYDLSTFKRYLFISPYDYNPPQPQIVIPQAGVFITEYQNYTIGIMPSIHVNRGLDIRLFTGYEIHYFHHKDETVDLSNASERWKENNQRRIEVAEKFVKENPMVPFVHHLALGAEVKFWRLGLEVKYLRGLNSPLQSVKFNDEFTYPLNTYVNSLYYSLKFYIRKDNDGNF